LLEDLIGEYSTVESRERGPGAARHDRMTGEEKRR
jgi:hypothetical protein